VEQQVALCALHEGTDGSAGDLALAELEREEDVAVHRGVELTLPGEEEIDLAVDRFSRDVEAQDVGLVVGLARSRARAYGVLLAPAGVDVVARRVDGIGDAEEGQAAEGRATRLGRRPGRTAPSRTEAVPVLTSGGEAVGGEVAVRVLEAGCVRDRVARATTRDRSEELVPNEQGEEPRLEV